MTSESLGPAATIVAIDGPAASGKSSVAKLLAKRLGVPFLNTGAMYRAVGRACHEAGVDHDDPGAAGQVAEALELDFDSSGGLLVGGQPWNVDGEQMGGWASRVAVHQPVREAMVARQRVLGQRSGCVAEGRDIGTVVFPAAPLKVFLVASPGVRAQRRAEQEGHPERAGRYEADLMDRDRRDREREIAPLRPAPGALELNSDELTLDQVVQRILGALPGAV
ncbi:MAG: (d)CMP kinase [Planctomycetota bacterium]|nr:(d)CMP kinase [Planctomycetota bacterium]